MGALVVLQLRARQNPWHTGLGGLVPDQSGPTFAIPGISVGGHVGGLLGAAAGLIVVPRQTPETTVGIRHAFLALTALGLGALAVVAAGVLAVGGGTEPGWSGFRATVGSDTVRPDAGPSAPQRSHRCTSSRPARRPTSRARPGR